MARAKFFKKFKKNLRARLSAPLQFNIFPFFKALFVLMMVVSMAIWIFLGGLFSIFIIRSFRDGSLQKLLSAQQTQQAQTQQQATQEQTQRPTEANLPGIGRVNIACVQEALSDSSIKNLVQAENVKVLTAEEKARFEKCLIKT